MSVFQILQDNLHTIFGMIPMIIQAKVSLDRVNEFLLKTELLDVYAAEAEGQPASTVVVVPTPNVEPNVIGIRDAAFTWSNENNGTLTPGTPGTNRRNFTLRVDQELTFKRNTINLIFGPTGSGKTSLLMALLGNKSFVPS